LFGEVGVLEALKVVVSGLCLILADSGEDSIAGEEAVGLAAVHLLQDLVVTGHGDAQIKIEQRLGQSIVVAAEQMGSPVTQYVQGAARVEEIVEVDSRTAPHAQLEVD